MSTEEGPLTEAEVEQFVTQLHEDVKAGDQDKIDQAFVRASIEAQQNLTDTVREYVCENCERTETLTEREAFSQGWDYPPFMGSWGVVSARTCPDCGINTTAWWHLITLGSQDIPEKHMRTIERILAENPNATNGR